MRSEVVLDKEHILENLHTEDELFELSTLEAVYQIRLLKALVHYGDSGIPISSSEVLSDNYVYLAEFDIHAKVKQINVRL